MIDNPMVMETCNGGSTGRKYDGEFLNYCALNSELTRSAKGSTLHLKQSRHVLGRGSSTSDLYSSTSTTTHPLHHPSPSSQPSPSDDSLAASNDLTLWAALRRVVNLMLSYRIEA